MSKGTRSLAYRGIIEDRRAFQAISPAPHKGCGHLRPEIHSLGILIDECYFEAVDQGLIDDGPGAMP
jgi:hypothetical protein